MLVLSSPSGAGKTTLSRRLIDHDRHLTMSVSATTRPPRSNEYEGQDYFFVSPEEFERRVREDAFLEHASVFGHRYGTPRTAVMEALALGRDVLFDIDWQGAQQLKQQRDDVVSVFILPPSRAELERRLKARGLDLEDVVQRRMARAGDEMSHWAEYDYVVVNTNLDHAVTEIRTILAAERLKRSRQTGVREFVRSLVGQANGGPQA
jgi:guanylate kinase